MTIALMIIGISLGMITLFLCIRAALFDVNLFMLVAGLGVIATLYTFFTANRVHLETLRAEFMAAQPDRKIAALTWTGTEFALTGPDYFKGEDRKLFACTGSGIVSNTVDINELGPLGTLCNDVHARLSEAQSAQPAAHAKLITVDARTGKPSLVKKNGRPICEVSGTDGTLRPVVGQTLAEFEAVAPLCATAASRITLAQARIAG